MISIIIPTFKEQAYLPRTLKALTMQTVIKDCEIIIVDYNPDWTTYTKDVCQEFIEKYKIDTKVVEIYNPGIALARNEGVLQSKGQYFLNFDADARFNRKDGLEKLLKPLMDGTALLTVCDNEFDYRQLSDKEMKDMTIPQQILDGINNAQAMGFPILEPGSCFNMGAFIDIGGFNDVKRWELSMLGPRFIWRFGKPKHVLGVSVIVSPRRALKLKELGIGAIDYAQAIRGNKVLGV